MDNPELLKKFVADFAEMPGMKILVHGGGVMASQMQKSMGMVPQMIEGRRVTDEETLRVVTMVYAGWCNKNIAALLQAQGCNAIGLTGADGNAIKARKRPPVYVESLNREVDYGFVGDVDKADGLMLSRLIEQGIVPIVAPLTHDGNGNLLNTNADTMAAETAKALSAHYDTRLIYCFEFPGVMRDPDDADSLIPTITRESYRTLLADGIVSGGMVPKIDNAFNAIDNGVGEVIITRADAIDGIQGTHIIP